jgi:4-hydroxymandelate oxidase
MKHDQLSLAEIYAKGREILTRRGTKWLFPPEARTGTSVQANREYLDRLFFVPKYFDPVKVDTSWTLFGVRLKTPAFCSPLSRPDYMPDLDLEQIARGVHNAGTLMMVGIGGADALQKVIDTGAPVVKIVKPYRKTELIYDKVRDAEQRGCAAVGMDIDHFYGALRGTRVLLSNEFGPQQTDELRQLISESKLPFVIKGVLSPVDAEKAVQLGATAIVVSNHGRSAIDFSLPSMIALPNIAESVGQKVTVLVDTGFQSGNDVLKALALGAKGVGFASSMLLAVAAGGEAEVENLLNLITAELRRTMAATGCPDLAAINRSILYEMRTPL